jgi:hypothetical protein
VNPNGTYFFQIRERELEEPSACFWGRRYEEFGDALYWDQEGRWYYSYYDQVEHRDGELVDIMSESLHCGRGIDGLINNMNHDWIGGMAHDELPHILLGYDTVSVDLRSDEEIAKAKSQAQSILERLRRAKKDDPEASAA